MNLLIKLLLPIVGLLLVLGGLLYVFQEKLIFFPQKLKRNFQFHFQQEFEEINITAVDGTILNGLLFKSENSKGLVFYLHGNAGNLNNWGGVAEVYTDLNYDVFLLDYRGFGKSEGTIKSEKQLFNDNQIAYDALKKKYNEEEITILGHSIGTGLAAKLASTNHPKRLILLTPYYSMADLVKNIYPYVPSFLLKYNLKTNEYLKNCKMPIVIFHGDEDEVVYYGSSLKLKEELKSNVELITLPGQSHNGVNENEDYKRKVAKILMN